ncbi:hypothetical protein HNQ69_000277 [Bartonella callosciuri]|uniref:Uncharacterized protein n=1 Tax=Bartonella callosciuri TaxID=686223 RepID=A0A840NT86_9HYPH|nr:hypothetical protein [Bartonella callosciuri]MBB5073173.1 hypothetical protein [Bartonella callosciuri]
MSDNTFQVSLKKFALCFLKGRFFAFRTVVELVRLEKIYQYEAEKLLIQRKRFLLRSLGKAEAIFQTPNL